MPGETPGCDYSPPILEQKILNRKGREGNPKQGNFIKSVRGIIAVVTGLAVAGLAAAQE